MAGRSSPPNVTVPEIRLTAFGDAEAADFVQRMTGVSAHDAGRVVEAIGGFPLALVVAVSILRAQGGKPDALLDVVSGLERLISGAAADARTGFYVLDTDDPREISQFEAALQEALEAEGANTELLPPQRGSWKRRFRTRYSSERMEQLLDKAERAVEVVSLAKPESEANRNHAEAIARLLEASASIPNVVLSAGSVLFIKTTDQRGSTVFSKTLTATELRYFDENKQLFATPAEALRWLEVLSTVEVDDITHPIAQASDRSRKTLTVESPIQLPPVST
jgi:hypothetical protein